MWKIKDNLTRHCNIEIIKEMLELNEQENNGGITKLIDRCVDGKQITFFGIERCPCYVVAEVLMLLIERNDVWTYSEVSRVQKGKS